MALRQGDRVKYVGTKQFTNDKGEPISLMGKIGELIAPIHNEAGKFVVEVEDNSYIFNERNLVKQPPLLPKDEQPRRKRRDADLD